MKILSANKRPPHAVLQTCTSTHTYTLHHTTTHTFKNRIKIILNSLSKYYCVVPLFFMNTNKFRKQFFFPCRYEISIVSTPYLCWTVIFLGYLILFYWKFLSCVPYLQQEFSVSDVYLTWKYFSHFINCLYYFYNSNHIYHVGLLL